MSNLLIQGKTILVTGGLGFIGSHCALQLIQKGCNVIIVDNLSNSSLAIEQKIRNLLTLEQQEKLKVYIIDLRNKDKLEVVFTDNKIDAIIHFASLKSVGESTIYPLKYYDNNIIGSIYLLELMQKYSVNKFIFSSSATVYGDAPLPLVEDDLVPSRSDCSYGQTKINLEYLLNDIAKASDLQVVCLRYFNPVGAHPSGKLGEELTSPTNIFPFLSTVYLGLQDHLVIFGTDYDTKDGTCERDYIHIMDLVEGHILALEYVFKHPEVTWEAFNLGTGSSLSVLEICQAFNKYADKPVKYIMGDRRPGDLPKSCASISKAEQKLGFKAKYNLQQMVEDTIKFLKFNNKV